MTAENFRPLLITVEENADYLLIGMKHPQLTDEENIEQLGQELVTVTEQYPHRRIIVTLKGVEYATSSVLGKLIALHRRLHREDGRLVLSEAAAVMTDILKTSRLNSYFHITPVLSDAIELVLRDDDGTESATGG